MESVSQQQVAILKDRKRILLEKRQRRAEREALLGAEGQTDGAIYEVPDPDGRKVIQGTQWER